DVFVFFVYFLCFFFVFFFKQKTAYEIGLGIPAEPLFRSEIVPSVVTDAASGVVDIFHGIDKAVADTWNNFWKDGKADGIGSNLRSEERRVGKECRYRGSPYH